MQQRDIQLNFVPKPPSLPLPSKTTFSPMSSTPICSRPFAPGFPSSSISALKLLMCGATSSSRAGTSEAVGGGCLNCRSLVRVWKVELSGRVEDDACEGASGSKAATMAGGGGGEGDCDGFEQLNQAQEYSRRRHFCQPDNFEVEADSSA